MLGWLSRGPPACFPQPVALQCDHRDRGVAWKATSSLPGGPH